MQLTPQTLPFGLNGLLGAVGLGAAIGVVCFAEKSQILTAEGFVKVEELEVGDVAVTASGETAPIVWIGSRDMPAPQQEDVERVSPICVSAGALGPNLPFQDLHVSPAHLLLVDGVFVAAGALINGGTITRTAPAPVTYYHVQCDRHVALVANGAAAESLLEGTDVTFFSHRSGADGQVVAIRAEPPRSQGLAGLAAPLATPEDVLRIRTRLVDHATKSLGFTEVAPPMRNTAA